MRNKNLKEKIEELVKEALEKMKAQRDEEQVEEEEVCIEPFAFTDADGNVLPIKQMEEELNKLYEEVGDIGEFLTYEEVMHPEACPSVEINEEEIEFIPINEVELEPEEIEELNKVTEDIKPIDDLLVIPCEVMGKEKLLVDSVNCNIRFIPILNIYVVAPVNTEIAKIELNAETRSDDEIQVHLIVYREDRSMIHVLSCVSTLVEAGIVSLISLVGDEALQISPAEFRGITNPVTMEEIKRLCEDK